MYSNIKVYQKYLVTSIKEGCATRSLYVSSGPKANNQRGRGSGPCCNSQQPIWIFHVNCVHKLLKSVNRHMVQTLVTNDFVWNAHRSRQKSWSSYTSHGKGTRWLVKTSIVHIHVFKGVRRHLESNEGNSHWIPCLAVSWLLLDIGGFTLFLKIEKRKRSDHDSVLWQKPLCHQKIKKKLRDITKAQPDTLSTPRLRTVLELATHNTWPNHWSLWHLSQEPHCARFRRVLTCSSIV